MVTILEELEQCCQLHEEIVITYVVDGYNVEIRREEGYGNQVAGAQGETIIEALQKLNDTINIEDWKRR